MDFIIGFYFAERNRILRMEENDTILLIPLSSIVLMSEWAQAVLTVGNIFVFIFAICGNLTGLLIIARSSLSKKSTKGLLITLALSDLTLVISSVPVDLAYVTSKYHDWTLGSFLCENVSFFQTMGVMMNAFCLFAIALERYLSVTQWLERGIRILKWKYSACVGLILVWILPIGAALPHFFWSYQLIPYKIFNDGYGFNNTSDPKPSNETYYVCFWPQEESFRINFLFYCSVGTIFVTLLLGFLFCYLSILKFIHTHAYASRRNRIGPEVSTISGSDTTLTNGQEQRRPRRNRHERSTRLIMILIGIFCICRLPVWIFVVVVNIEEVEMTELTLSLMHFLHLLSNLSTALSPILYSIFNKSLRSSKAGRNHPSRHPSRNSSFCPTTSCNLFRDNGRFSIFLIHPPKRDRYELGSRENSLTLNGTHGITWKNSVDQY